MQITFSVVYHLYSFDFFLKTPPYKDKIIWSNKDLTHALEESVYYK